MVSCSEVIRLEYLTNGIIDALFTILSLVIAAICNPIRVIRQIWPYISVLIAFTAFVVWNGGVVLGMSLRVVTDSGNS